MTRQVPFKNAPKHLDMRSLLTPIPPRTLVRIGAPRARLRSITKKGALAHIGALSRKKLIRIENYEL